MNEVTRCRQFVTGRYNVVQLEKINLKVNKICKLIE